MALDVLAFFAHPDDETMLIGGTLALLASQGARVHCLIATRGEGGDLGVPPLASREGLGQVREEELRCAVSALGLASLTIMDYVDPTVGADEQLFPFTDDLDGLSAQLIDEIRVHSAGALISHGVNGEYGHPAHRLVYQAAKLAVHALSDEAPLFYTVSASFPGHPRPHLANPDSRADLVVDVHPTLSQKVEAALCHRTQHDLFTRNTAKEVGHPVSVAEAVLAVESLQRISPPVDQPGPLHDALADLLWASGCARLPAPE